jgi:hypothetical protein
MHALSGEKAFVVPPLCRKPLSAARASPHLDSPSDNKEQCHPEKSKHEKGAVGVKQLKRHVPEGSDNGNVSCENQNPVVS